MKSATLSLLLLVTVVPLLGQADPPDRVGRVGYTSGSVSFQPAGVEDWVPASPNRPITTGDQLWVDEGSSAEMHVGSTALRLGSQTAFQFLNLDDANTQIRLSTGSLNIHLRFLDDGESVEVDTPNMAFSILRPGDYRIDTQPDSQTTLVTVRDGTGEITGGGQAFSVHPGEQASVTGDQSINYNVYRAPDPDDWDSWCRDRQTREEHSASLRWVSPRMTGYADLDENGDWRSSPYGEVWSPRNVPNGWAPYHYGHWAWIDPWGWSWVDDAAWGFAPFHYGRWAYWSNNWVWIPGPVEARPVYAPALVAWVGGGRFGASMSLGDGAVAWVPLGPREAYVPPYHTSPTYVTHVNNSTTIVNVTNIHNTTNVTTVNYVNARAPNAVVAVSAQTMGSGRSVHEVSRPVPAAALASGQVMRSAQVAPQLQAVAGHGNASVNVRRPPAGIANQAVVVKRPPPPSPVSFARRQQALQSNPGVPLNAEQMQQIRQSAPPSRAIVVRQAPPAAHVVQPVVAPRPPQNAIQARPGGPQPSAPPAPAQVNRPEAPPVPNPPVQPAYRPAPAPAPVNRPVAPPVSNPPVQPAYRPAPAPAPVNRPAAPPVSNPPAQPAYRPAPAPAPVNRPAAPPVSNPPVQPAYRPAPAPAPVNRPAAPPVSNPPVQPAYRPAPAPAQVNRPAAAPVSNPPVQPAYRPAPAPAQVNRPVTPPVSNPPVQPAYRPAPAPAQVNRPAAPPVPNPPVQPAYRPAAPPHGTAQPAAAQPPPKQDKKTAKPPQDKEKEKGKE
ncbi:MAG: DUF6600 domain-containing protein [Terriglobia bacterium]